MNKQLKKISLRFLCIFLPLTAVITLGVSLYIWYEALTPEPVKITAIKPSQVVTSRAFSAGLEGNLRDMLIDYGIPEKEMSFHKSISFEDSTIKIYKIKIPETVSFTLFNLRLTEMAKEMGGHVLQGIENSEKKILTLTLGIGETPTDILVIQKSKRFVAHKAKVAVVIDDLGIKSLDLARRLCNLEQVVTLAILPFQRFTSQVIDIAKETDTPYILHMPMEPKSKHADPGKGALYIGDDKSIVDKKLARAFKSVQGAEGLNNHMGSKATEDVRTMEYVMHYLRKNKYFFVDSQTSRQSKGYYISQKSGVKGTMITGYIDVKDEKEYIKNRLDTLVESAFDNGPSLILGHDRPNTIDVLEKSLPELEKKGVQFVRLSELVH